MVPKDNRAQSRILGIGLLEFLDNCYKLYTKFLSVSHSHHDNTTQSMTQCYGITASLLFSIVCHNTSFFYFLDYHKWPIQVQLQLENRASLKLPRGPCVMQTAVFFLSFSFLNTKPDLKPFMYPAWPWTHNLPVLSLQVLGSEVCANHSLLSVLFFEERQQCLFHSQAKPYLFSSLLAGLFSHGSTLPNTYIIRMLTHKSNYKSF